MRGPDQSCLYFRGMEGWGMDDGHRCSGPATEPFGPGGDAPGPNGEGAGYLSLNSAVSADPSVVVIFTE
jgi:hypothetical protein